MLRDELSSELQQALADAEDAKDDAISAAESAARDVADSEIAWVRAEVGPACYCSPCHKTASKINNRQLKTRVDDVWSSTCQALSISQDGIHIES
jgi:hypothetical protein